ncbi:MAG: ferrous iron transporter B [Candidatus Kapabacteria bacterium]|nr:ferrous iron transporter B [Candidatus Kapabacteria bacterium]
MESHVPLIALVGTPNCGKSTIFNALTGLHQKVGNFPGVTVEPGVGTVTVGESHHTLVDLPGIYSTKPKSVDEEFTIQTLTGEHRKTLRRPDATFFVIDGTNLEKGLTLYSQFRSFGLPTAIVVTMIDAIKAGGAVLDDIGLEHELGVPVITVVGNKGIGLDDMKIQMQKTDGFAIPPTNGQAMGIAHDESIEHHVAWARALSERVLTVHTVDKFSLKLDGVLLHPVWGFVVFLAVMALFFQSIFSWAEPLMNVIDSGVASAQTLAATVLPQGIILDFISKGIVAGIGSVIVFVPQIALLSLLITLLEDCGYLARAAFIMDRIMGVFGLQGRSFVPLLGSFACAIPGIMSARIIPSRNDRLITILIAPLMACSARLPVYTLLIASFIPAVAVAEIFSLQAVVMAALYALGLFIGLVVAFLLRRLMIPSDKIPFLIEFPPYRVPSAKSIALSVWGRVKDFLTTAGTVILLLSVILWAMTEFPRADIPAGTPELDAQRIQLEQSAAGTLGKAIQPVFAPLGFDWKITLGVIGSFAAREVFVSVMGQIYATDVAESDAGLRQVLQREIPFATATGIILFYVFALQCMSTVAIIRRETGSWKWSAFAFAYTFALAYTAGAIGHYLAS